MPSEASEYAEMTQDKLNEARDLLRAVLRGEDILTDKKWLRRAKALVGDDE